MKFSAILFLGLTSLFFIHKVNALPFIYTFEGNIIEVENNGSVVPSATIGGVDFSVGDPITYRFLVDFQQSGKCLDPSEITAACDGSPILDAPGFDYFLAVLVNASKMAPPTYLDIVYAYGESWFAFEFGRLSGNSAIYVSTDSLVQNWNVETLISPATILTGYDAWDNASNNYGLISSSLTLMRIDPVPEPTPAFLIPLGIACLLMVQRISRVARRSVHMNSSAL